MFGIDLGTTNTLIYKKGEGVIINEPSVLAFNKKTGEVVAIGNEARYMQGKTPSHIQVTRPIKNGVINDFEVAEIMLSHFFSTIKKGIWSFIFKPNILAGMPSNLTEVEKGSIEDVLKDVGFGKVILIENLLAGAIGAGSPIQESTGSLIVNIGGGTTEMGLVSMGGLVLKNTLNIAGDKIDHDIMDYIRDKYKLLISQRAAENLKIEIGSAIKLKEKINFTLSGRDAVKGIPKEIVVTDTDVREAISDSLNAIRDAVSDMLYQIPPELSGDLLYHNIIITGGGSLLKGFPEFLQEKIEIKVRLADDPLTSVSRGHGMILENYNEMKKML
ncbi:MAG: Cell shape-determining protein MreB [Parcubacteria group bacterium GW2011_GWA2_31_28]|nr:MAG: Cell shape-determining protein MreB [Parcubacteria group bacterium GW2011_GWA2_31_28]